MESYLIFDLIVLVFILLSALFAFLRGFSQESLSLLSWIGAFIGSYSLGNHSINFINKFLDNLIISSILAYILVFIILLFFFSYITKKFSNTVKHSEIGMIDRTLGFIFGIIRGYFLVSLCLFSFNFFYDENKVEWIENSKINFVVLLTNSKILNFLSENSQYSKKITNEIKEKSEDLFEKSIDSHLKLKNHFDKTDELYEKENRKNLEYLIENSVQ